MKHMTTLLMALGTVALAATAAIAAEHTGPHMGPWPGWHTHSFGFWWICPLIMLFMFAFFALIFFGSRGDRGHWRPPWRWMSEEAEHWQAYEGGRGAASESALDILNKRYARGEIDKAEYEERRATITSTDN